MWLRTFFIVRQWGRAHALTSPLACSRRWHLCAWSSRTSCCWISLRFSGSAVGPADVTATPPPLAIGSMDACCWGCCWSCCWWVKMYKKVKSRSFKTLKSGKCCSILIHFRREQHCAALLVGNVRASKLDQPCLARSWQRPLWARCGKAAGCLQG